MTQSKLEAFLERLQSTSSSEDLKACIVELRQLYNVRHVLYHTVNAKGEQFGALTYDAAWVRHYLESNYTMVDPTVVGTARRYHPVDWKELDWSPRPARKLLGESLDAGLGNQGWSVPIWGPQGELAVLTLNDRTSDTAWAAFTQAHLRDFLLIGHYVHQQGKRLRDNELAQAAPPLSPREKDVLTMLAIGRSRGAIAEALQISENTLRAYIDSARHKLGALNTTHAVAVALAKRVISP